MGERLSPHQAALEKVRVARRNVRRATGDTWWLDEKITLEEALADVIEALEELLDAHGIDHQS